MTSARYSWSAVVAALGATAVALAGSPARAEAITVTLKTSQFRSMSVPLLPRSRPVRQRQVRDGYVRLLRRAETVCRVAAREGRSRRQPAVTGSKSQVKRFNSARGRLNVLLRRLRLPAAPRIRDFSQLGKLWILKRLRHRRGSKVVSATPIAAKLNCRFD